MFRLFTVLVDKYLIIFFVIICLLCNIINVSKISIFCKIYLYLDCILTLFSTSSSLCIFLDSIFIILLLNHFDEYRHVYLKLKFGISSIYAKYY